MESTISILYMSINWTDVKSRHYSRKFAAAPCQDPDNLFLHSLAKHPTGTVDLSNLPNEESFNETIVALGYDQMSLDELVSKLRREKFNSAASKFLLFTIGKPPCTYSGPVWENFTRLAFMSANFHRHVKAMWAESVIRPMNSSALNDSALVHAPIAERKEETHCNIKEERDVLSEAAAAPEPLKDDGPPLNMMEVIHID